MQHYIALLGCVLFLLCLHLVLKVDDTLLSVQQYEASAASAQILSSNAAEHSFL